MSPAISRLLAAKQDLAMLATVYADTASEYTSDDPRRVAALEALMEAALCFSKRRCAVFVERHLSGVRDEVAESRTQFDAYGDPDGDE